MITKLMGSVCKFFVEVSYPFFTEAKIFLLPLMRYCPSSKKLAGSIEIIDLGGNSSVCH